MFLSPLFLILGGLAAVAPLAAAIPLVALRILAEERVLSTGAAYLKYASQVRWRLIPLVW